MDLEAMNQPSTVLTLGNNGTQSTTAAVMRDDVFLKPWVKRKCSRRSGSPNYSQMCSSLAGSSSEPEEPDLTETEISTAAVRRGEQTVVQVWHFGKAFVSHQALGGHKGSHRINQPENVSSLKRGEEPRLMNSTIQNLLRKGKSYKCSICSRVFLTGQALGGHKRFHYGTNSEDRDGRKFTKLCGDDLIAHAENRRNVGLINLNLPPLPDLD
ncbi:unnamed protein product [Eruca vesicaria subsp. sativa]|uniref:C2H2-type domain-containing protein n=1 Tax=Eruca vesicaria subsp. sativa TaxID=29727 RepID=A0ABC8J3Q4_ERUVS|nr:unnamed protein product [Eruca vesicaria subsp. sativa]